MMVVAVIVLREGNAGKEYCGERRESCKSC